MRNTENERSAKKSSSPDSRRESGLEVRRDVLGHEYVDNSLKVSSEFEKEFQELITEYCWGTVWTRPGLPRQTRSLLNIGMMTALNRPHELEIHALGALRNGCSIAEIQEVVMQAAIYCGLPAAIDAFRIVRSIDPTQT